MPVNFLVKKYQLLQKCQNLQKISKFVKNIKICKKYQNLQKISNFVKKSCLLLQIDFCQQKIREKKKNIGFFLFILTIYYFSK
jgi:hypothetical protein